MSFLRFGLSDFPAQKRISSLSFWILLFIFTFESATALSQPNKAQQDETDAATAKQQNIPLESVIRLHDEVGLSNQQIIELPKDVLKDTLQGLKHPEIKQLRHSFRYLQEQNEDGVVPEGALLKAARQLKNLKQMAPPNRKAAGIPVGESDNMLELTAGVEPSKWQWKGPGNIGGRTRSILIHPNEPKKMWLGSVGGGIWHSPDGGENWKPVDDFMANLAVCCMAMNPDNPNEMYAGTGEGFFNGDALRGAGIFKSSDGGKKWTQLAKTDNSNFFQVNRISISKDGKTILAATGNGIYRNSTAGTGDWNVQEFGNFLDLDFHPTDSNKAIAGLRTGGAVFSDDGGTTWSPATGLPASGRVEITYAAKDGSIAYASADSGGGKLYRSSDGGQSYTLKNNSTGYLGQQGWYDNIVWAGDPNNANFVIVGGVDLWKSTNGGTDLEEISTWWASPDSAHADHHFIAAHPKFNGTSNKTVYFANDGGIYKTEDVYKVGNNPSRPKTNGWISLNNNYGVTQFYGVAGNVSTGNIVAGTQDNGTLQFKISAGAQNWNEMFGGDGGWCAADPNDSNYFYGEYVFLNIHRSTNGGESAEYISGQFWDGSKWTFKSAPFVIPDAENNQANFIAPFVLDPNESNRILGGGLSLWRTNNAKAPNTNTSGPKWAEIKSPIGSSRFQHAISAIDVADGNSNLIVIGHNNGEVYRTENGTNGSPTWKRLDNGSTALPNRYCHRLTIDPHDHKTIYATFGGYVKGNVWKSTDSGNTWLNVGSSLPEAPVRSLVVHPKNQKFVYIGTEVGVFASEDGGTTWSPANEGPTNCSVDELIWMGTKLVAATHGRGIFEIDVPGTGGTNQTDADFEELLGRLESKIEDQSNELDEIKQIFQQLKEAYYDRDN